MRTKTVYKTDEIPHLFVHRPAGLDYARNPQSNLYFRGNVLYSYRDSYPIAHIVTNKRGMAVLIQENRYSSTTAKHLSDVRHATSHMQCFEVPYLLTGINEEKYQHTANVTFYKREIEAQELNAMRARSNAEWQRNNLDRLILQSNNYMTYFGIRRKPFAVTDPEKLKERCKVQAVKNREANKRKAAALAERRAGILERAKPHIDKWLAGDPGGYIPYDVPVTYLRVEGEEVVTSKGARFPLEHAIKGLAFVRHVKATGEPYTRNGHTFHLGRYAIDRIDAAGNVTAGCHHVSYEEIERVAPMLTAGGSSYEVQGFYPPGGWEMVTVEDTRKEARARLKEYRENEPGTAFRLRTLRVKLEVQA